MVIGMKKRVLIGCEFSGTVRDAFIAAGFDAMSCDLLPTTSPGPHYQGDIFDVIDDGWDLAIFHPPCTFLSSSGLHWNKNPNSYRFGGHQTEDALIFVRRLLDAKIKRKALENPQGCIGTRIRPATQFVQPYNFGDDASKNTGLWLENLPQLTPTKFFKPRMVCYGCKKTSTYDAAFGKGCPHCGAEAGMLKPRWANQTDSGQNRLGPSEDRWAERSITYPGIAAAMVSKWGRVLREEDIEL